jgi:GH24 family phage-related lysozyme (muramidase)
MDIMFKMIRDHEGYRLNPYKDTEDYLTGGIGHKFTKKDFQEWNPNWDVDTKKLYWKDRFVEDVDRAYTQAKKIQKEFNIDDSNEVVTTVLTDMVFNLGAEGVRGFPKFLKALSNRDKIGAIREMKIGSNGGKSLWYKQVGRRVDDLAKLIEENL